MDIMELHANNISIIMASLIDGCSWQIWCTAKYVGNIVEFAYQIHNLCKMSSL